MGNLEMKKWRRWNMREYVAFGLVRLSLWTARKLPSGRYDDLLADVTLTLNYERRHRATVGRGGCFPEHPDSQPGEKSEFLPEGF